MPADFFGPMPASEYHADMTAYSKSMLNDFRERRRLFQAKYITKTAPAKKATRQMDIGTLTHADILEPGGSAGQYVLIPDWMLSGENLSISSKEAKQFRDMHLKAGKIVVKQSQLEQIKRMADSVRQACKPWLDLPSKREEVVYWSHDETGLPLRCRPDWLVMSGGTAFNFDVKTSDSADPERFKWKCEDFAYWLQHAHYTEGIHAATALPVEFYFVVVETEFPFACSVCRLDERTIRFAEDARLKLLRDLETCIRLDDWSEPWEKRISDIALRHWKIEPSALPY